MSKMIDTASHNAAKLRLLNANKQTLVDASGNPFEVSDATIHGESELRTVQVYIGATPKDKVTEVMEIALVGFFQRIGVIITDDNGEWQTMLPPDELQSRGTWLSSTPDSVHPEYFAWDDTVVLHFVK